MRSRGTVWAILILVAVASVIIAPSSDLAGAESGGAEVYINIRTPQVKMLINEASKMEESDLVLLDVREPEEYEEGHIPGAILIPLSELKARLEELERNKRILVICRSGNRSARASQIMVDAGFERVYNYNGGMMTWDGPVVTGSEPL